MQRLYRIIFLFLFFVSLLLYLPSAFQSGWKSDDYVQVYGLFPQIPVPSIKMSLQRGSGYQWSVVRVLCYPIIGFGGMYLGNVLAQSVAVVLHGLAGSLVFVFLQRLRFHWLASIYGALFFIVAPWATQPVVWWSAVNTNTSTIAMLIAGLFVIRWAESSRLLYLFMVWFFALFSMFLYDLWLAGYIFLLGTFVYFSLEKKTLNFTNLFSARILKGVLYLLLPFVLWATLYVLTFPPNAPNVHHPVFEIHRLPVLLVSVHLRIVHWFTDTPWLNGLEHGISTLQEPIALLCLSITGFLLYLIKTRSSSFSNDATTETLPETPFLLKGILLAWSVFLGSRLIIILKGGVALHSRLSYGAAIAAGVLVCVVVNYLLQTRHRYLRPVLIGLTLTLTLMAITTAGLAYHSASTARAEKYTWERLSKELKVSDADRQIVITGDPTGTRGELPYFEEYNGGWLEFLLQQSLGTHFDVFVAPSATLQGNTLIATTYSGKTERISLKNTIWYAWEGKELVRKQ
jgi:hypothetical protein